MTINGYVEWLAIVSIVLYGLMVLSLFLPMEVKTIKADKSYYIVKFIFELAFVLPLIGRVLTWW